LKNKEIKTENIKIEITTKINEVLTEFDIPEINNIAVINLKNQKSYLGSISLFDFNKIETIENKLIEIFKDYDSYSIKNKEIVSCCKPTYNNINFKVNLDKKITK